MSRLARYLFCMLPPCMGASIAIGQTRTGQLGTNPFGYAFRIPERWHVEMDGGRTLLLKYSTRPPQGLLPPNGAEILIVPRSSQIGRVSQLSLREWVSHVLRVSSPVGRSISHPQIFGRSDLGDMTRVSFTLENFAERSEGHVDYLFCLRGEVFKVGLRFIVGDSGASQYENILDEVLRSFRVTK
jgi:hypothetical protein